ncbi:hypothetical protein Misp01_43910 [Microtetraspora sp. NBRC 13810]|uniref:DUF1003 domain-containing protein n=1 Tax=Microtetraspora sp. NBRC 13810 TaxID=3030990 RepID=UPI0024A2C4AD|nr:DUF1003 domain-containing protein [Microtetraspora sp. NBRC 13810]GLW09262.1 hypothetical protein Misp01_43910 [Microtetraspora sp. NBRC 13810]
MSAHPSPTRPLRRHDGWEPYPQARAGRRPVRGEQAAETARDVLGSWRFICAAVIAVVAVAGSTVIRGQRTDLAVVLDLTLSAVAVVELALILMAARRTDLVNGEQALHDRRAARRTEAVSIELRDEMERLHLDLARLTARVETSCRECGHRPERDYK